MLSIFFLILNKREQYNYISKQMTDGAKANLDWASRAVTQCFFNSISNNYVQKKTFKKTCLKVSKIGSKKYISSTVFNIWFAISLSIQIC
jgi:hypothetical protein